MSKAWVKQTKVRSGQKLMSKLRLLQQNYVIRGKKKVLSNIYFALSYIGVETMPAQLTYTQYYCLINNVSFTVQVMPTF